MKKTRTFLKHAGRATALSFLIMLLCSVFTNTRANNYYWVGGGPTTDVNLIQNWATTSGGSVHPGNTPGQGDDVIFDANSGFTPANHTVTNPSGPFSVHSMIWTGALNNPIFNSTYSVTIYGSLILTTGMTFISAGLTFTAPAGNPTDSINTMGTTISSNMTFNGAATWNINNALTTVGVISMEGGIINTNNYTINAVQVVSTVGGIGATLNLGSSVVTTTYFVSNTPDFILAAGTSTINVTSYLGFAAKKGDVYNNVVLGFSGGQPMPFSGAAKIASLTANVGITFQVPDTIGILTLNANATYNLIAGAANTLLVTGSLITASAACSTPAQLVSSSSGTQAFINMPTGTTINNFVIQDINAIGSPTANSSLDNGDNSGWSFTAGAPNNLYWINGSGNYSDPTHWSLTSGGAAANCVPTAYTNVFFDNHSFTTGSATVTLNNNAYCDSMTWAGSATLPTFNAGGQNMYIYGSLVFQTGMTQVGSFSSFNFNSFGTSGSPAAQTITSHGVSIIGAYPRFAGYSSWTLMDSLKTGTITLAYGTLNTNNQNVSINGFTGATGVLPAVLNLGSSIVTVNAGLSGNSGIFNTDFPNLTLIAGTSTIKASAAAYSFTITSQTGDVFYNVEFDNTSGSGQISGTGTATYNKITTTAIGINFDNSNTIDSLIVVPGYTYLFNAATTQNILMEFTGLISGASACSGNLSIVKSNPTTSQATINIPNTINGTGIADLAGSIVTGIKATGSGTMNATGSINNGNNSININFIPISGGSGTAPEYWVGGTGNWNDPNHWSYSSGGPVEHACPFLPIRFILT